MSSGRHLLSCFEEEPVPIPLPIGTVVLGRDKSQPEPSETKPLLGISGKNVSRQQAALTCTAEGGIRLLSTGLNRTAVITVGSTGSEMLLLKQAEQTSLMPGTHVVLDGEQFLSSTRQLLSQHCAFTVLPVASESPRLGPV